MGESKESWWKKKSILCNFKKQKIYNNKPANWVGHSKLGSLEMDEFFKRTQFFYEKEASVTGKTEEEKNIDRKTSNDDDANAEDNEIINKDK